MSKILLVEDQPDLAEPLAQGLAEEGYSVQIAETGKKALSLIGGSWDLVVLDLMLPDISGEAILQHLTTQSAYPPVLVLTAKNQLSDKLSVFRKGCDDFLTKPFIFDELLHRVKALLRRPRQVRSIASKYHDIVLDPRSLRVSVNGRSISLTPKESALLGVLINEPDKIVPKAHLLQSVWGISEAPLQDSNFLGVHMCNLKKNWDV